MKYVIKWAKMYAATDVDWKPYIDSKTLVFSSYAEADEFLKKYKQAFEGAAKIVQIQNETSPIQ